MKVFVYTKKGSKLFTVIDNVISITTDKVNGIIRILPDGGFYNEFPTNKYKTTAYQN